MLIPVSSRSAFECAYASRETSMGKRTCITHSIIGRSVILDAMYSIHPRHRYHEDLLRPVLTELQEFIASHTQRCDVARDMLQERIESCRTQFAELIVDHIRRGERPPCSMKFDLESVH